MVRPKKPPIEVKSHGVGTRVPQGQSARMARGRAAKAKVDKNRAAVEALNAKADADAAAVERAAVRVRAAVATDDPELAEALAHSGGNLLEPEDSDVLVRDDAGRYRRNAAWWWWFKLVEAEASALKAWEVRRLADPKFKGKRPATTNHDRFIEIKQEEAEMGTTTRKAARGGGAGKPASKFADAANAAKKKAGGKQPKRTPLDGQPLMDHVVKLVKAHPGETPIMYRRHSLFVDGLAVSVKTLDECVARALKGETKAPASAVKTPARKAAKKAALRDVVTSPKGSEKRTPPAKASAKHAADGKARTEKRQAKKVARARGASVKKAPANGNGHKDVTPRFKDQVKKAPAKRTPVAHPKRKVAARKTTTKR